MVHLQIHRLHRSHFYGPPGNTLKGRVAVHLVPSAAPILRALGVDPHGETPRNNRANLS